MTFARNALRTAHTTLALPAPASGAGVTKSLYKASLTSRLERLEHERIISMSQASKRLIKELMLTVLAYALSMLAWTKLLWPSESKITDALFMAIPIVPAIVMILIFMRFLKSLDELQQRIQYLAIGFSALATGLTTYTIGNLESMWASQGFYFHAPWVLPMLFGY
jgi:hypothetical protein